MKDKRPALPLRWQMPIAQLSLCFLILWPMRGFLLFDLSQSARAYAPVRANRLPSATVNIELPSLSPEGRKAAERVARTEQLRMRVPIVLDFPVVIAQIPYILANPEKREWTPRGMLTETWRALSWPFAGIVFWWYAGRGIEAVRAARRSIAVPRMTLAETASAAVLLCIGLATLVGLITSTPDDRRDYQFLSLLAGGLLWGILASFTVAARILQWRMKKRGVPCPSAL
jgi:hypothetical protein